MEPEQPIEEMLKASARKRRAEFGSDSSMPNPMRTRLHDEIAALGRPEKKVPRFRFVWPRFALATAAVALLIGLPLLWQWRMSNPQRTFSAAHEMNAPAAAATSRGDEKNEAGTKEVADAARASSQVAAAAAAPAAAKTGGVTQQFAQVAQQEAAKAPNVLSNFRLEQNGESVRVIDADGSIYTGRMEPLALNDARALANQKLDYATQKARSASAARKDNNDERANEFYIQASGYNTQLKKALSFEGNYIAPASTANEMQTKDKGNVNQARIVGTAKVEGAPPVQVDAKAAPP